MEIGAVAVIGAGVMGHGIAQTLAVAGYPVRLYDIRTEALAGAMERIEHGRFGLRRAVSLGKLAADAVGPALGRITTTTDLARACDGVGLVVEAVPEDLALKVRIFRQLDALAPPRAILASNTSGFPIAPLAEATDRPSRVIGWHWASPAPIMRLAEIAVHKGTAHDVRDAVVAVALACGKNPQVIQDTGFAWGFVANRIMRATRREAERVVAEGIATPEQVDTLLKDCFRWPVGPFEMAGGRTRQGWE